MTKIELTQEELFLLVEAMDEEFLISIDLEVEGDEADE